MSIVLTGTPGVGKHTVAGKLAGRLGLGVVDVNLVARESGLVGPGGDVDVRGLAAAMGERLAAPALVVGHLAPYVLSPGQARRVIVLRRDPYGLLATYAGRGYSEEKSTDNAGSEILGVILHDARGRFGDMVVQVDASDGDAALRKAEDAASGGWGGDEVDWLGLVARNGDLGKFFPY